MISTGRGPCSAFSVFAGGLTHPAPSPDNAPSQSPPNSWTPTCSPNRVGTPSPPQQPLSKGVPGPRRGQRPWLQEKLRQGWCQSRMPLPGGQILRYILHSQHLHSPADMDNLLSLGKQAKRPLRGLPSPPWHCCCQASHALRDSPILIPWVSHSCRH